MMAQTTPVLIVGAGPSGLSLAILLRLYGIPFRLIEQKSEGISTSNALIVQPRSLEMWDAMGVADAAIAAGTRILGLQLSDSTSKIQKISFERAHLASPFPFMLGLPQSDSEHLLAQHLTSLDGHLERGTQLLSFSETDKGVQAQIQLSSGTVESIQCDWLIAADGARSTIRKRLNLPFKGGDSPERFIMMDAEISNTFEPHYFHAILSKLGPLVFAPLKHFTRIICSVTHDLGIPDSENPTVADFNHVIQERSSLPITIEKPLWISHFTTHHRMIDQFNLGRILFLGDSAHIHSPVGGQGMNTGMQDAYNLAWKLALVIKGKSAAPLLNTYNSERRPLAQSILSRTSNMTRLVTLNSRTLITLRNFALRLMLSIQRVQKNLLSQLSELTITYAPSIISPQGAKRAPSVNLIHPQGHEINLYRLLNGLPFKVLLFTGKKHTSENTQAIADLTQWIAKQTDGLWDAIVISSKKPEGNETSIYYDPNGLAHKHYGLENGGMCVIRPDQYMAFTNTQIDPTILTTYQHTLSHP